MEEPDNDIQNQGQYNRKENGCHDWEIERSILTLNSNVPR